MKSSEYPVTYIHILCTYNVHVHMYILGLEWILSFTPFTITVGYQIIALKIHDLFAQKYADVYICSIGVFTDHG